MGNQTQILDRSHKSLSIILGLCATLALAYNTPWIPRCIFFILVLHVIGIITYLALPWDSWEWSPKDEVAKATFRRWSKRLHVAIVIALFVSPVICIGIAFSIGCLPTYVDETFSQSLTEASEARTTTNEYVQASLVGSNATVFTNSFVGMPKGQIVILLSTQTMVKNIVKPLAHTYVSNGALPIAEVIGVGFIILLLFEKFVRVFNENKDAPKPSTN